MVDGGPWSFEQAMLIYKHVDEGKDSTAVQLNEIEMWMQIYDIPMGFLSENIIRSMGASIGRYI